MKEKKCKNCMLFNREKSECKVAFIIDGEETHLPVEPEDDCHFLELGIEVNQVRWFEEDGKVKIEYPPDFFGPEIKSID